jgi:protein O-GlcNAc transferase
VAYRDLCLLLFQSGRLDEARQLLTDGIAHNPGFVDLHFYLGNVQHELQQFDLAVASFERALAIQPQQPAVLANLGLALLRKGDLDPAIAALRQALTLNPQLVDAYNNLGNALQGTNRFDDAMAVYRQGLAVAPRSAGLHSNLGFLLQGQSKIDEAIVHFRIALDIDPGHTDAHNNLGNALQAQKKTDEAIVCYRQLLAIDPHNANAHSNLGNALSDIGLLDDAMRSYRQALEISPDFTDARSNLLFNHNYRVDQPATTMIEEARCFGDVVARKAVPYSNWRGAPEPGRSLRIGLVSGDLRNHPVGYFLESVLVSLASNAVDRLEIIAYPTRLLAGTLTERIKACCRDWYCITGLSDEIAAQRIHDDGIDILIDLSGHSAYNRLPMFAWKPAPVQVSWLGYFATTGVAAIDYLIADPWTIPASEEPQFT